MVGRRDSSYPPTQDSAVIPKILSRLAPAVALALFASTIPSAHEVTAQSVQFIEADSDQSGHNAEAQAWVMGIANAALYFISEGYKAVPADQIVHRIDDYLAQMRELAPKVVGTPAAATLSSFLAQFERVRSDIAAVQAFQGQGSPAVTGTPQDRDNAALQKLRALLSEITAANGYASLSPSRRLAALDAYLARLEALGPEAAGTRAAKIYENALRDTRQERASAAALLGRDPAAAPGAAEGPYTDFEWMGQRGVMALSNPLQRDDFRASLARGIDFNVGVSEIEPSPSGWLVHLSGRLGSSGTPGQGFFCKVAGSDAASLEVLRGITPPYGIVHMKAPGIDAFTLQSNPLRIRIVFDGCRISPLNNGTRRSESIATGGPAAPSAPVLDSTSRTGPVAPSPANLRCQIKPPRREHERVMAHRLRQAWAIPEALQDDPTLLLTFAVTLNFDAELTAPVELLSSISQRATPEQLRMAVEAGRQAIIASAPFPELGQFAGGTMQIDMTPCD